MAEKIRKREALCAEQIRKENEARGKSQNAANVCSWQRKPKDRKEREKVIQL